MNNVNGRARTSVDALVYSVAQKHDLPKRVFVLANDTRNNRHYFAVANISYNDGEPVVSSSVSRTSVEPISYFKGLAHNHTNVSLVCDAATAAALEKEHLQQVNIKVYFCNGK